MTDAEISRDLALALGYAPESVQVIVAPKESFVMVYRLGIVSRHPEWLNTKRETWLLFDYRDATIAMPLLRWLMVEHAHTATFTRHWDGGEKVFCVSEPATGVYPWSDTLELAIARAVIAVGKK